MYCVCVCLFLGVQSDSEGSMSGQSQSVVDGGGGAARAPPPATPRVASPPADQRSVSSISSPNQNGSEVPRPLVRRVVRRAGPGVEEQPPPSPEPPKPAPAPTSVPKTTKAPTQATSKEDDISMGLASLMGRGRTKEHRSRSRAAEIQKPAEETKQENPTSATATAPPPTANPPKTDPLAPPVSFLPSHKPMSPTPPTGINPPSKPDPLAPPAGFIPATKPNPLAPPTGFIPPAKQDPLAPPVGFLPNLKSNPPAPPSISAPPPKPDPLAPPAGFVPVPKRDPFAPVAGFLPRPKVDPLAPPAGFIPAQRPTAVRKPEGPTKPAIPWAPEIAALWYRRVSGVVMVSEVFLVVSSRSVLITLLQSPLFLLQVKTEEQIAAERAWYGTEKVWLVHKDGFSLATQLKTEAGSLPEGKAKIRLEHDGTLLEVEEDDVEKANAPSFDRVEDLSVLPYLNESSVMHCLRQRYGGNLIHTYAGANIVVINPVSAPSMYSEKVRHQFQPSGLLCSITCVYTINNAISFFQYVFSIVFFSAEKWQAVYTILEAFGNCGTSMNGNASRFSHVVSLDFDQAGQVASASIQTMLLEKSRVAKRPDAESTFNIFYYLMAGADGSLKTELHFNHFAENSAFGILPNSKPEEKQKAAQQFTKLQAAMKVLNISAEEQRAFWLVLGAIYHLGAAGATKAGRKQFARHEWAQKAAYLLGCTLEELSSSIFKPQAKGTLPRTSSVRLGAEDSGDNAGSKATAVECLEAMGAGLYSELFTLLISLINRALKSTQHSLCSVLIVDTPGFQNPRQVKSERGATFEELCHNYAQERLQALFHERTFKQELERYKEENIELALDDIEPSTSLSIAAVDQASSQALVRTPARTDEARGLLWLMEEEALQPGGSEDTLLERLFSYYGPAEGESKGHTLLLKGERPQHFLLGHSHETDWVEYDARGWLNHTKQNPASQNAASLLQNSQKKNISTLFIGRSGSATVLSGSIAGLEGGSQLALRRATSMRKTFTTGVAAVKKKSLSIQIKLQVDALLDTVRRSRVHFVHCLLPRADASRGSGSPEAQSESCDPGLMQLDVALLRAQLRGSKLLDALRIYRQGFPDHMVFSEFRRRFDVLAPHLTKKLGRNYIVKDEKRAVEELLESLDLEKSSYHMGLSRVFFKAGTLAKLEEQRDEQTRRNITLFQASCRGYLARQAFKKRKVQDLAIRCIQKNIQKNRGVKGWPWWKLFTTVYWKSNLTDKEVELCGQNVKLEQLEAELQDLSSQESKDEASLAKLKKQLRDLEAKVKDQEEELDEQAGTIQMLEQAKLRLEMEMERLRQTHSKEIESKDEEVEEIRQSCSKKLKQMEVQLEEEYDDKQRVLREKRELENKLLSAQDQVSQRDVETERRLKKDLKRTKVLLGDAQVMLDHLKNNAPSKREISQLKNQLEESEFTCSASVKARKAMELEIEDLHIQMEDMSKAKMSLEEQMSRLQREKNDLQSRLEEDQEDMNELMKKHKAAVAQSARDLAQISDLQAQLEEAVKEKQEIQDKVQCVLVECNQILTMVVQNQVTLVARLKENLEKMTEEKDQRTASENREKEQNKRLQRQIRDTKEEMTELAKKEAEASRKKHELEMDIESLEAANQSLQADLKLAFKRIGDLQAAIEDEMESDDNDDLINSGDDSDMDSEVEDRVDGVKSWLSKNKGSAKTLSDEGSLKTPRLVGLWKKIKDHLKVENLWNINKRKMNDHKPSDQTELLDFLPQEWHKVIQKQCARMVQEKMPICMKTVIKTSIIPPNF
uniref:Myosin XVIIIAa n=1 Tax=Astyanax mexicanus TaxID=7994 RepID=A0A8B9H5J9_ASTMX